MPCHGRVFHFASTVFLLAFGRVADIYGRARLFNLGFVLFTLGSVLYRIGARIPASTGLLIQALAVFWLSTVTAQSPYLHIAVGLGLMGLGGGLFWSPNTSAAMGAAPPARLGVAAATLATLRNTGMVTSFALALAVAAASLPTDLMLKLFTGTSIQLKPTLMEAFRPRHAGGIQSVHRRLPPRRRPVPGAWRGRRTRILTLPRPPSLGRRG